ncbi:MAG: ABC transporter ATP-binding protein [Candidatus Helarchaeota archaeon]
MDIRVENLTKKFGNVVAVNDLSITFPSGQLTALLGPSGCGKSTFLYMLAGITPVTSGKIFFDNKDVTNMSPEYRGVGLVFQNYALYPHMNVLQNICFPLEMQKVPKPEKISRVLKMAELVHIEDLLDRKPSELSGGQQQRVAITRALVKKPDLLLLDEPLSNLDARLRIEMREEIRRIQTETGVTTIFVTHDQEEAMSISDKILLIKLGLKQQYQNSQELYDNPSNLFVARFLGNPPINQVFGTFKNRKFSLNDSSETYLFSEDISKAEDKEVILAIRPESIFINDSKEGEFFNARVNEIFRMGKEELIQFSIGNKEIRGYLPTIEKITIGDEIPISLKKKGVFLFDAHSGDRCL